MNFDYNVYTVVYLSQIVILLGVYAIAWHRDLPARSAFYFTQKLSGSRPRRFGAKVLSFLVIFSPIFFVTSAANMSPLYFKSSERDLSVTGLLASTVLLNACYMVFSGIPFLMLTGFRLKSKIQKGAITSVICFSAAFFFIITISSISNLHSDSTVVEMESTPVEEEIRKFLTQISFSDISLKIVKSDQVNAYANPDGIYLMEGLIEKLKVSEIIWVVAHEVAHISNKDSEVTALLLLGVFAVCLALVWVFSFLNKFGSNGNLYNGNYANGFSLFVFLFLLCLPFAKTCWTQYKRMNEVSADAKAVEYLVNRGGSIEDFETASAKTSGKLPDPTFLTDLLMYDHPTHRERVENMRKTKAKLTRAE